jgi:hypothetical protein
VGSGLSMLATSSNPASTRRWAGKTPLRKPKPSSNRPVAPLAKPPRSLAILLRICPHRRVCQCSVTTLSLAPKCVGHLYQHQRR